MGKPYDAKFIGKHLGHYNTIIRDSINRGISIIKADIVLKNKYYE